MSEKRKFEHLEAVRGLAAFVVLLSHVVQIYWLRIVGLNSWPHLVSSWASHYAVIVFFILSGFLITHSIETNAARHGSLRLSEFFAARFARLYPPFLFAIVISVLVYVGLEIFGLPGRAVPMTVPGDIYAARDIVHLSGSEVFTALFMLRGMLDINGPFWSLYMEAKLYVLFACAYAIYAGRYSIILAAVFCVTLLAGWRYNPEFLRYAAVWLTGVCAYYFYSGRSDVVWVRLIWLGVFPVSLIVAIDLVAPHLEMRAPRGDGRAVWIDAVIAAAIAWMLFAVKPRLAFGQGMAYYSYSLYAVHFPVLLIFQSILVSTGDTSVMGACIVSVLGGLTAIALAMIGGRLELAKPRFQMSTLSLWHMISKKDVD